MAKQDYNQYIMPAVFLVIAVLIVGAVGIGTATGQAAWSTGENSKRTLLVDCDDTDNGQDYDHYGVTTVSGVEYADVCVARDTNTHESKWPTVDKSTYLKEYYCERGEAKYYITSCGCESGICLEEQSRY